MNYSLSIKWLIPVSTGWRLDIDELGDAPGGLMVYGHGTVAKAMIRVLIADDSAAIREGMTALLGSTGDFQIIGFASDGMEAVEKASELVPDVVIMDAQMPNMDGVEATKRIKEALPGTKVLFLSGFTTYLEEGIAAGADGYSLKDCEPEELISELIRVAAINDEPLT